MDLRRLRYFVAVAEEGHFGRAAERLHVVQPALSMQIKTLEEELGGALFVRTSRRVTLTPAGEVLLTEALRLLAQVARVDEEVRRSIRGEVGLVRVGFTANAVIVGKLTEDLRHFRQRFPDVTLQLHEIVPQRQPAALLSGEIDVAYGPSYGIPFDPGLLLDKVGEWPLVVALADDHPLAAQGSITRQALAAEPIILYADSNSGEGPLLKLRQLLGDEVRIVHRVSETFSLLALAAAGLGVALVPASLGEISLPNLAFRPLAGDSEIVDLMLISRPDENSPAVRAYLELARIQGKSTASS